MRVPHISYSPERFLNVYGLYHLARLRADPETEDLAKKFSQAQDRLKAQIEALTKAEADSMTALAVRDTKDDQLDDAIRTFFFTILAKVVNDREHPTFLRYFPDGLTDVVGIPPDDEINAVGILLTKLAKEEDEDLKAHAEPIQQALDGLVSAIQSDTEATNAERLARQEMHEEKLRWIDAYMYSYRQLQLLFYKNARRAERYFRSPTRREPTPEEVAPEAAVAEETGTLEQPSAREETERTLEPAAEPEEEVSETTER